MSGNERPLNEETRVLRTLDEEPQKSSPLYLLTGLVIGVILGLIYAWAINPVKYERVTPARLQAREKDVYRGTIAQVYAVTGDLERALKRLALLEDDDPAMTLGAQAQRSLAAGNIEEARALALLSSRLQTEGDTSPTLPASAPQTPIIEEPSTGVPTQTLPATTPLP